MIDNRPDPDELLSAIKREEASAQTGSLRIFFGMSAGVGKTYAMLRAAQDKRLEGVDVVVGIVETHGRAETQRLLEGLTVIPRQDIVYRDVSLQEMDIAAILNRHPQIVLVDELAHTNVPGSRHNKRWQDVLEILSAGINVYTTLNVQHLESRKEFVEQITGITIRETVPDTILEQASQISLVDITPTELLQRLKEGKVYLGERAETAANNFFKEDKLTALREILLRITAEAVSDKLDNLSSAEGRAERYHTAERLMVAVSHSPHSEDLTRATRRIAFSMDAPWYAVHVNTGEALNDEDSNRLAHNLSLAQELGGEVISVTDVDVVGALARVARQRNATQLIVGRPQKRSFRDIFRGGTLIDRLSKETDSFDIHVLKPVRQASASRRRSGNSSDTTPLLNYWLVLWVIVAAGLLGTFVEPLIGYRAVGFVFLMAVLTAGLFMSIGPTIFASLLAASAWNLFFIPPRFTFVISQPEDVAMCLSLLVTALITGILTTRIRRREQLLRKQEQETTILYEIARKISAFGDRIKLAEVTSGELERLLKGKIGIALKTLDGSLAHVGDGDSLFWMTSDKEWEVARWAYEHRSEAGWSTNTLPGSTAWFIPLNGPTEVVGVLAFRPEKNTPLSQRETSLLKAVARQLSVAAERELFQERSFRSQQAAESEKLYLTILNSVSHEMRTPLTTIIGAASALQNDQIASDEKSRRQLAHELSINAERLNRVVSNLLDMSRLRSGKLKLKLDWHDVADLITTSFDRHRELLCNHKVTIKLEQTIPLVRIDFALFEQVLGNILANAALYTEQGTRIDIAAKVTENDLLLSISDTGKGIPDTSLAHIFEPFYRVPGSPAGGTGIGLAIAKGIVEAHRGTILAEKNSVGGTRFIIRIPVERQPDILNEADDDK